MSAVQASPAAPAREAAYPQARATRRFRGPSSFNLTRVGWWAWLLHRITGVALVGYVLLHIGVISTALIGNSTFDSTLAFLQTPLFVVLDLGLVAAVLYHALNGIRVILFDMGLGIKSQAAAWWAVMAISVVLTVAATVATWPLIFR